MAIHLTRRRPATLTIDGQPVAILCKRLTLEEASAHRALVRGLLNRPRDAQAEPVSADDAAAVQHAIHEYISVKPGELTVDGEPVATGAQLMELIAEDPAALMRAMLAIMGVSTPTRDEGLPSASESVSVPSSDVSPTAPVGPTPARIATDAEQEAFAETVDATAAMASPLSGPMGTSS